MAMNGIMATGPCSCSVVKCWKWNINNIFGHNHSKYAVVVLNRPISQNQDVVKRVWNNAAVRITVDGGTVHWDKFINRLLENEQTTMKLPDLITGDFDSITDDVMQKYKEKGCKIIHTPDQNNTDFTKALIELNNYCEERQTRMDDVLAIAQTSGRIDQIIANIQTLHLVKKTCLLHPRTRICIMSDDSLSWLLPPGDHIIDIPEDTRKHKKAWCSLVPMGETCSSATTSGLKWDLDNEELKFGKLVSTSNTFNGSDQVKIKCSHTLLWSMKVPSLISK